MLPAQVARAAHGLLFACLFVPLEGISFGAAFWQALSEFADTPPLSEEEPPDTRAGKARDAAGAAAATAFFSSSHAACVFWRAVVGALRRGASREKRGKRRLIAACVCVGSCLLWHETPR